MQFPFSEQFARLIEGIRSQLATIPVNKEVHLRTFSIPPSIKYRIPVGYSMQEVSYRDISLLALNKIEDSLQIFNANGESVMVYLESAMM